MEIELRRFPFTEYKGLNESQSRVKDLDSWTRGLEKNNKLK